MADLDVALEVEVSSSVAILPPSPAPTSPTPSTSTSSNSHTTATATCSEISVSDSNSSLGNELNGDDVVCIGEFRPSSAILPCFLPCCKNTYANRVIPVRIMHSNETITPVRPCFSGLVIPTTEPLRRPTLFPEPPESEWITATVYHWDPRNEVLRYKCKSCNGLIERLSFMTRSQFFTEQLPNQCVNCYRTLRASQQNQFLNGNFTQVQTFKVIHCLPIKAKIHTMKTPYPNRRPNKR